MKYQAALKEKNVKKEDLSKKVQAKIEALDKLVEKANLAVDDDELEQYNSSISDLDNQITKDIKKFNLEVHKRRLESIASLNDKRFNKEPKAQVESPKESVPVKMDTQEIEETEQPKELPVAENVKMKGSLEQLRQKALEAEELRLYQERVKQFRAEQAEQEQEQEPEEIQDFQKADGVKRKKPKIAYGLIGLGVFFLTWGAVNLARQK